MRISHAHRFVYFSIPKTASESVRKLLDPFSDVEIRKFNTRDAEHRYYSHQRPVEVAADFDAHGLDFGSYFRFATVRNPWARAASLFMMAKRARAIPPETRFRDWIRGLDPTGAAAGHMDQKWYPHGMMSMSTFLRNGEGKCLVDRCYRIEDQLPALCADLQDRIASDPPIASVPLVNVSKKGYSWRDFYEDAEDRRIIHRLYEEDIERFGYSF